MAGNQERIPVTGTLVLTGKAPAPAAARKSRKKKPVVSENNKGGVNMTQQTTESRSSNGWLIAVAIVVGAAMIALALLWASGLGIAPNPALVSAAPVANPPAVANPPSGPGVAPKVVDPAPVNQPVNPAPVTGVCPTEREFEILTGVRADIVREEPCAFHWRGDPQTITAIHPCPAGWSCTLGSNGQNFVFQGDNGLPSMQIFAATWRLVDMYPSGDAVYNSCAFLKKVQNEGVISDPTWTASAGNFSCP